MVFVTDAGAPRRTRCRLCCLPPWKPLAAVVVGLLVSAFITQTIGRRIQLSADMRRKLPLLEKRLNRYVPNALRILRTVIVVAGDHGGAGRLGVPLTWPPGMPPKAGFWSGQQADQRRHYPARGYRGMGGAGKP